MPFCETCGTKNADEFKFCIECGKPVASTPVAEDKPSKPKQDLLKNKAVVFGGGGALALALIAVLVVALTPFSLDAKTAETKLMAVKDFAFDAAFSDDPYTAEDSAYPIYRASDECSADVDMQSMINDEGTLLASADFKENVPETNSVHVDEDIIRFETDELANKFVALARDGYDDPDCEYNSTGDYVSTTGILSGASDVQSRLGVGGSNSFFVRYQSTMEASGYYSFTIATDSRIAVVARGRYVGIFRGTIDADTDSVSGDDMELSLKTAISKVFG